ncbi:MAG: glycosyltransferase [bacterium]
MTHIATIFDKNYLVRALALRNSLYRFAPKATVWFLCLDNEAFELLKKLELKNTNIINLEEVNDQELMSKRDSRTSVEFAMGSKASFLKYMLDSNKIHPGDGLVFIDADILFYSDANKLFEKTVQNESIVLTAHKFSKEKEYLAPIRGYFNSGMIFFRNDENARKCIEEWRKQCIEWCSLVYENGKHTDQLYLNAWPKKYKGVFELPNKGVNTGTWNIENFKITKKDGLFFVDEDVLICYHAHGLRIYVDGKMVRAYPITVFHSEIYDIYVKALQEAYEQIIKIRPDWNYGFVKKPDILRLTKQKILRYFRDLKNNI